MNQITAIWVLDLNVQKHSLYLSPSPPPTAVWQAVTLVDTGPAALR